MVVYSAANAGLSWYIRESMLTQSIYQSSSDTLPKISIQKDLSSPPILANPPTGAFLTLHIVDTGQILPLAGRIEYTLGRVADGQPILPDVDLSAYDAYSQGVSRLHAALRIANQKVTVVDLGSSNGTRVNGQKISPNFDYPINHGDIIALGEVQNTGAISTLTQKVGKNNANYFAPYTER